MEIKKVRLIEPGNLPYRKSLLNLFVYDKYIRTGRFRFGKRGKA
ncbi:hypothetical protein [Papillibacter cinnamivorans]|uniref:Uncharacterized protein n=1 Tax=Papillibacter cinnamivorans DSM 12816 TaxID=1122930 RepID=A0A1W1ZLD7_9FIRM|nr:hypothetical protein [Papillibacter cinnamivorans]SMC49204.1 hypothetical protein SAMN02745168_1221 [Papillibacter cinnamivorans DSM 12816]